MFAETVSKIELGNPGTWAIRGHNTYLTAGQSGDTIPIWAIRGQGNPGTQYLFDGRPMRCHSRIMARLARVVVPGMAHHVTQRGNRRQQTFFEDADYRAYRDQNAGTLECGDTTHIPESLNAGTLHTFPRA
jgi:hypothetical protein